MSVDRTYYDVLGISETAPDAVVKAAHRALMKSLHPDTATGDLAQAKAVNEAFRVLASPSSRQEYDDKLSAERAQRTTREPRPTPPDQHTDIDEEDDWGEEAEWTAPESSRPPPEPPKPARPAPKPTDRGAPARKDFATANPATLAGVNVWDRERIDQSSMPWFTRDYGGTQKREHPRLKRITARFPRSVRFWAWVSFTLLCVLAALPVIPMIIDAVEQGRLLGEAAETAAMGQDAVEPLVMAVLGIMAYLLLGPGLAFLAGRRRARRTQGLVRYLLYLMAGAALCLQVARTGGAAAALPFLLVLVLFALTVELFRAGRPPLGGRRRLLPRADVRRYNRWGTPGGGHSHAAHILPDWAAAQIMTGQLIDSVLQTIPKAKGVHGLRMPGSDVAVNHAVLCGRRLAIVNSESWMGGDAYWLNGALMFAHPHLKATVQPYPFTQAPAAFAGVFGRLEVRGWLVLHSKDGRGFRINNQEAGSTRIVTPEDFLREVGEWLSEEHPAKVRRRVLSALVLHHQR